MFLSCAFFLFSLISGSTAISCSDLSGDEHFNNKFYPNCYFLYKEGKKTFDSAQQACSQNISPHKGATARLAAIYTGAELHILQGTIYEAYGTSVPSPASWWVGLRQFNTLHEPAGGWGWVNANTQSQNQSSDSHTPWHNGQPDNSGGRENCGAMSMYGNEFGLNDIQCDRTDETVGYWCEIECFDCTT